MSDITSVYSRPDGLGRQVKITALTPRDRLSEAVISYGVGREEDQDSIRLDPHSVVRLERILRDYNSERPVRLPEDAETRADQQSATPIRDRTLDAAKSLVSGQRAADYGDARESFTRIAAIWTAILGTPVTAGQAALMLAGLKMARLAQTIDHEDSWVDLAGYAALGAEVTS